MLAAAVGVLLLLLALSQFKGFQNQATRVDLAMLRWLAEARSDGLTSFMELVANLGSEVTVRIIRWGTLLALLVFKRFRHLFVFLGCVLGVGWITTNLAIYFLRPRPTGLEILTHWLGSSFPSRPVAALAVTLVGICYCLVVQGPPRQMAKLVSFGLIALVGLARLYLGADHPLDVVVGGLLGATVPVMGFRLLAPNDAFPVRYKRGRAAHLDVGGHRGEAIRRALEEQLGITVEEIKPFGLVGSGGSTPLRLRVPGDPATHLFGKLYATNHLRADRWYKLGRTLLYGRLEDEGSFSTVRRLVQYEDYMLRAMRDAGLNTPAPHGFVEITPEREYLLVTDFVAGAQELLEADVDDEVIDEVLRLVRQLWDAGIAHRDIKPSNLLVRDGRVHLIDVAFGQIRPSPWRQAVDLANAMLAVALRSDPDRVYGRALRFFTPQEIAEAFAATKGVTMPSQSRGLLRAQKRDVLGRFRELAPSAPPISIQRWSWRRAMLSAGVLMGAIVASSAVLGNLNGAGLLEPPKATNAAYSAVLKTPECRAPGTDQIVLATQSVPSASLLPCLDALPLGWQFQAMDVRDGRTRLLLSSDRVGPHALEVTLAAACDTSRATEVPSDEPGARQYEQIEDIANRYSGVRYYVFEGGCATYRFDFSGRGRTVLGREASLALGFVEREVVARKIKASTGAPL